ncbi:hypothetical protein [Bradyrhizobium manausense]|uniref:hypothetical protein n=1 Tax=Bradyrhizobium manausense TaxID=989370 RepID=UPI0039080179
MAAIALQTTHHRSEIRPVQIATLSLDPDVVSASIPAFFIGRNQAGLWVARAANGRIGGLFLFKSSAIDFANRHSAPARCALVFPTGTFELDIENRGNPLISLAAQVKRLFARFAARSRA